MKRMRGIPEKATRRREPDPGMVYAVPLADGTWGLAQYLGHGLVAVFAHRSAEPGSADEVSGRPVAFRVATDASLWRTGRWRPLGAVALDPRLLTPRRCCQPIDGDPERADVWEWRWDVGTANDAVLPIRDCRDTEPHSALLEAIELRLLRVLEGIPYDPWWFYLDTHPSIDWALPRPASYRWEVELHPDPDGIDAALRGRLRGPTAPPSVAPRGPTSPLEVDESVGLLFLALGQTRASKRPPLIEAALRDAASSEGATRALEVGSRAIAAAVLVAFATGRNVDCGPFADGVMRRYARDLGADRGEALIPLAIAALEAVLASGSGLAAHLEGAKDGPQLRARIEELAALVREPRREVEAPAAASPPPPASALESHSQVAGFFQWLEQHESSEWPELIARALGLAAKARGGLDVDQASHAVAAAVVVALASGKSVPVGSHGGGLLGSAVASVRGRAADELRPLARKALAKATRPSPELGQLLRETGQYDGYRLRLQELAEALEG